MVQHIIRKAAQKRSCSLVRLHGMIIITSLMFAAMPAATLWAHNSEGPHSRAQRHSITESGVLDPNGEEQQKKEQLHFESCLIQDTLFAITMRYLHPDISVDRMMKVLHFIFQLLEGKCPYASSQAFQALPSKPAGLPPGEVVKARLSLGEIFALLGLTQADAETFFHRLEHTKSLLRYVHSEGSSAYLLYLRISAQALSVLKNYRAALINAGIFNFTPFFKSLEATAG